MKPQDDLAGESRTDFVLGDWHVQSSLDRIARQGESLHLEPKLMDLLLHLMQHRGAVLSKEELLEKVWGTHFVGESTLSRAIAELRRALGDDAQTPRYIETIPRRGYRLIAAVTPWTPTVSGGSGRAPEPAIPATVPARLTRSRIGVGLALVAALGVAGFLYSRTAAPALSDKDVVLIADFENTTGDPLFDDTLQQAFVIQMEQSPYFNVYPTERMRKTLEWMKRSPDERVTPALAREICERQGIAAMLVGSLAPLGESYVITLQAISAKSGETLVREQVQAPSREEILPALGGAASKLRRKLGESRASIERFDKPLVEATTSSLEALRFYTEAAKLADAGKPAEAIPFVRKAVELDPEFGRAYVSLAAAYRNSGNEAAVRPAIARAYELRDRVTERDRYWLTHAYLGEVKKDLLAERENLELAVRAYPRYRLFRVNLAVSYLREARYAEAVEQAAEAMRLADAESGPPRLVQAIALQALGRYEEAKRTLAERPPDSLDNDVHAVWLTIAFAQGDQAAIRRNLDWGRDHRFAANTHFAPSDFAVLAADMELFEGRRPRQAFAEISDAAFLAYLARESAALGDCDSARGLLGRVPGDTGSLRTVAFALCGDVNDAFQAFAELEKAWDALPAEARTVGVPSAEAMLEHSRGNFTLAREKLEPALKFQLGWIDGFLTTYVLGLGYLGEGRGSEAAAAFEKILAHRGIDPTAVLYPLSYLGLARAATLTGDTARARKAYEDLFAVWSRADPDLPALVAARAEYALLPPIVSSAAATGAPPPTSR